MNICTQQNWFVGPAAEGTETETESFHASSSNVAKLEAINPEGEKH